MIIKQKASMANTGRIEYVDALRGFSILLVVLSHVEIFGFFHFTDKTIIWQVIISFVMPLFFFISGFVTYKKEDWNLKWWSVVTAKKARVLLIPTFVFGLIYTYLYLGKNFSAFIINPSKLGYWFTLSLFEMFAVYYTINLLVQNARNSAHDTLWFILLVTTAIAFYLLKLPLKYYAGLRKFSDILSLHYTFEFFQFFAIGLIASKYRDVFERLIDNKHIMAAIIAIFFILSYVQYSIIDIHISKKIDIWIMLSTLIGTALGYTGLFAVWGCFRKGRQSLSSETGIGRALQFLGKRTLDIYMLHYFFLPSLPQIGEFLKSTPSNVVIELLIGMSLTIAIVLCCLAMSSVLRTSDFISYWFFGRKQDAQVS